MEQIGDVCPDCFQVIRFDNISAQEYVRFKNISQNCSKAEVVGGADTGNDDNDASDPEYMIPTPSSFGIIAIRRYSDPRQLGTIERIEPVDGIVFKDQFNRSEIPERDSLLYLMIQRKDTMGYIDFIRGKYPDPKTRDGLALLQTYFDEMTYAEIQRIKNWTFRQIWDTLWVNHSGACYVREFEYARHKYIKNLGYVDHLLDMGNWGRREYGFPKGRKNMQESNLKCAIREFCEETGYSRTDFRIIPCGSYEESFVGTNGIAYKHVYYLAEVFDHVDTPQIDPTKVQQVGEIRDVGWFTFKECLALIRDYDTAKKGLLKRIHDGYHDWYHP
ncbi:hypothetical protein HK102_000167, partial [Quaeritorhiza haematococci]